MMRCIVASLFIVLSFGVSAGEPKSAATYEPPSQQQAAKTESRQQPSETTKENAHSAASQGEQEQEDFWRRFYKFSITDALIAAFTLGLLIFSGLLWCSTKRAAQVLPLIERAYVYAEVKFNGAYQDSTGMNISCDAVFSNRGKTPAVISQLRGYITAEREPPKRLNDPLNDENLPEGLAIASGDFEKRPLDGHITTEEDSDIHAVAKHLYAVGFIEYKDILGDIRKTGFCWEYREITNGIWDGNFVFCRNSKLNYTT